MWLHSKRFLKSFFVSLVMYIAAILISRLIMVGVFTSFGLWIDQIQRSMTAVGSMLWLRLGISIMAAVLIAPSVRWFSDREYVKALFRYNQQMYQALSFQNMTLFNRLSESEIIDRFEEDTILFQTSLYQIYTDGVLGIIMVVACGTSLMVVSPVLALLSFLILIVQFGLSAIHSKSIGTSTIENQGAKNWIYGFENSLLEGFEYIRSRKDGSRVLRENSDHVKENYLKIGGYTWLNERINLIRAIVDQWSYMGVVIVVLMMMSRGMISTESSSLAILLCSYMKEAATMLSQTAVSLKKARVLSGRLDDLFAVEKSAVNGVNLIGDITSLSFENVDFSYDQSVAVLQNFSLAFEGPGIHRLEGGNGMGKTTITHILTGLYTCQSGSVRLNNQLIDGLCKTHLREKIALSPQMPFVLNLTVEDNIRLFVAINDELEFDAVINDLDMGSLLDKKIENYGENLSGGERQKISLARCFLKKSSLSIFDEPFNALDFKTIDRVRSRIETLDGMVVLISHMA